MDNRIPGPIRASILAARRTSPGDGLKFADWIAKREHQATDWIIVAQSWLEDGASWGTFSALFAGGERAIRRLLQSPEWEIHTEFGHPYLEEREGSVSYRRGDVEVVRGIRFQPFVLSRTFHGYLPWDYALIQDLELFFRAFWDDDNLMKISGEGELRTIARRRKRGDSQRIIEVDTHHLRQYLTARNSRLVRFHDHHRWATEEFDDESMLIREDRRILELNIRANPLMDDRRTISSLRGKDIVEPYESIDPREFNLSFEKDDYVDFIIGRDGGGELIEETCNDNELSSYFRDTGKVHSLTPVFFRPEVLQLYYDKPRLFRVTNEMVSCLDLWAIPIDRTGEDLVQVWLGDLGRIPPSHQQHWRQYNVTPQGKITEERLRTDFLGEFVAARSDPLRDFQRAFDSIQKIVKELYGAPLFLDLRQEDAHVAQSLRLPLSDEWREFDELVGYAAKLTVDSLDVKTLERASGLKIEGEIRGSLDLLETFLAQISDADQANAAAHGLRRLQSVRSAGAAHRKGKKFLQLMEDLDPDHTGKRALFGELLRTATESLILVAKAIRERPPLDNPAHVPGSCRGQESTGCAGVL